MHIKKKPRIANYLLVTPHITTYRLFRKKKKECKPLSQKRAALSRHIRTVSDIGVGQPRECLGKKEKKKNSLNERGLKMLREATRGTAQSLAPPPQGSKMPSQSHRGKKKSPVRASINKKGKILGEMLWLGLA
jgi:hypothetical protein